jgi:hypothetical protein
VVVSCFVHRPQRGAKDWSATRSVQGQTSIKRYFCYPSFSCISLDRFERKSVSMLSTFLSRVKVKLLEVDLPVRREIFLQQSKWNNSKTPGLHIKFDIFIIVT